MSTPLWKIPAPAADEPAEAFLDGKIGAYEPTTEQDVAIMQFFKYLSDRIGRALTRAAAPHAPLALAIAWNQRDPAAIAAKAEGDRRAAEWEAKRPRYVPPSEEQDAT